MKPDVNDRGAKKWGKFMMPEFTENLKQIYNSPGYAKSAPEAAKLEKLILSVTNQQIRVMINYNPAGTVYEMYGYILQWNQQQKIITLLDDEGRKRELHFSEVESMKIKPSF